MAKQQYAPPSRKGIIALCVAVPAGIISIVVDRRGGFPIDAMQFAIAGIVVAVGFLLMWFVRCKVHKYKTVCLCISGFTVGCGMYPIAEIVLDLFLVYDHLLMLEMESFWKEYL